MEKTLGLLFTTNPLAGSAQTPFMCRTQHPTMPPTVQPVAMSPHISSDEATSGTGSPLSTCSRSTFTTSTEINGTTFFHTNHDNSVFPLYLNDNRSTTSSPGAISFDNGHIPIVSSVPVHLPPPPIAVPYNPNVQGYPLAPYGQMSHFPLPSFLGRGPSCSQVPVGENLSIEIPSQQQAPDQIQCASAQGGMMTPSVSTNMGLVWHAHFQHRFGGFPHQWTLQPSTADPEDRKLHIFKDSAKVRFCCPCGNGWTSMKGRVMFSFTLDRSSNCGVVKFRLFGQLCSKCKNKEFIHAMWYPEEVVKVVDNIHLRVGTVYYKFEKVTLQLDRRQGKPRHQHNSDLCQACAEGVCREGFIVT